MKWIRWALLAAAAASLTYHVFTDPGDPMKTTDQLHPLGNENTATKDRP